MAPGHPLYMKVHRTVTTYIPDVPLDVPRRSVRETVYRRRSGREIEISRCTNDIVWCQRRRREIGIGRVRESPLEISVNRRCTNEVWITRRQRLPALVALEISPPDEATVVDE